MRIVSHPTFSNSPCKVHPKTITHLVKVQKGPLLNHDRPIHIDTKRPFTVGPAEPKIIIPYANLISSYGRTDNPNSTGMIARQMSNYTPFNIARCLDPPKIIYTSCETEANHWLSKLEGKALGFNLVWHSKWDSPQITEQDARPALMKFCDEKLVVLYHVDLGDLPDKAIEIISDPQLIKVGVNYDSELLKLLWEFPEIFWKTDPSVDFNEHQPREMFCPSPRLMAQVNRDAKYPSSALDVSKLALKVDKEIWKVPPKTMIRLPELCRHYLDQDLCRRPESTTLSDWTGRELSQEFVNYAANNVYAILQVYHRLMSIAEVRGIHLDLEGLFTQVDDTPMLKMESESTQSTTSNETKEKSKL